MPLRPPAHVPGVVGLRLARRHFRHGLAGAEPHGNGQAGLADHALPELAGELPAPKEAVHPTEVRVEFVDGTLFADRHGFPHDLRHDFRLLGIGHRVAPNHDRFRAHRPGHLHGHPGVHPKPPRLIAAGRHHASVARPSNQDGPAFEARVHAPLHRHEEGVEVQVQDRPLPPRILGRRCRHGEGVGNVVHETDPSKSETGLLK